MASPDLISSAKRNVAIIPAQHKINPPETRIHTIGRELPNALETAPACRLSCNPFLASGKIPKKSRVIDPEKRIAIPVSMFQTSDMAVSKNTWARLRIDRLRIRWSKVYTEMAGQKNRIGQY